MADITSTLLKQLTTPKVLGTVSEQLGFDSDKLNSATSALLPMLIAGLTKNSQQSGGANSLFDALKRDHDGSLLNDIVGMVSKQVVRGGTKGGILQMLIKLLMSIFSGGAKQTGNQGINPRTLDGDSILEYILGDKRKLIEQAIGKVSDLNLEQVNQLASKLAPLLMGSLGKLQREQNLNAQGLSDLLQREVTQLEQKAPPQNATSLIEMLDLDNDGDIADDLMDLSQYLRHSQS